MRPLVSLLIASLLEACIASTPPAPAPVRNAMPVNASFSRTWDAVIDVFAAKNIPIRTMERASGFIVADQMTVPYPNRGEVSPYADCGTMMKIPQPPTHANYNIRVKGDSAQSTVQVTVLWKHVISGSRGEGEATQCSTKGLWEKDAESEIKAKAEAR